MEEGEKANRMSADSIKSRLESPGFIKMMSVMIVVLLIVMTAMYYSQKETTFALCRLYCTDVHGEYAQAISDGSNCDCFVPTEGLKKDSEDFEFDFNFTLPSQ